MKRVSRLLNVVNAGDQGRGDASEGAKNSKLAQSDPVLEAIGAQKGARQQVRRRSKPPGGFHWHKSLAAFLVLPKDQRPEVSTTQIAVLWALVCYADKDGRCWPKQKTLGRSTGLSRSGLQKALRELKTLRLLLVEHHAGRGQANTYVLRLPYAH